MRKIQLLANLLLITNIGLFTSCKKDSTEDLTPTINFIGGADYVSSDVTLAPGADFLVGINASANTSSNTKLASFKVVRTFANVPETVFETSSSINSGTYTWSDNLTAKESAGTERWTFTITDKDGETSEVSFNITTVGTASTISTYTDIILGSYNNTSNGSSFASSTGNVYMIADAKANADKIDWLFYNGVSNLATLAAPDDSDAGTIFNGTTNGLQTWSVLNPTRFRLVTEGAVWDNVLNATDIADIATNTTASFVKELAVGDILAFKTAANKLGLIKVSAITPGGAGSITYTVKVQK
jgi:hypothetical protein